MPPLSTAGAAEILRSTQKDEQYIQELRSHVTDIIQKLAGIQKWIKWRHEINAACDFLYFLITTLSGLQTLGEEYVHIVQIDRTFRRIPSLLRRSMSVLIETSGSLVLKFFLSKAERTLQDIHIPHSAGGENLRLILLRWLPQLQYALTLLHRFHLVAFYFYGTHYHLSKRFSGIQYVSLRNWLSDHHSPRSYRLLGWLTFFQLSLNVCLQLHSYVVTKKVELEAGDVKDRIKGVCEHLACPAERCCLCLEKRRHSTTTPCGHLFCWSCIMEWLQTKRECPLCRDKVEPSQLVYLQNYS